MQEAGCGSVQALVPDPERASQLRETGNAIERRLWILIPSRTDKFGRTEVSPGEIPFPGDVAPPPPPGAVYNGVDYLIL